MDRIAFLKKQIAELKAERKKKEEQKKLEEEYNNLKHPHLYKAKKTISSSVENVLSSKPSKSKKKKDNWDFGIDIDARNYGKGFFQ